MQGLWQKIAGLLRMSRLERRWRKAARILAIAVVFVTTYMLILPAITLENQTYCGLEEHTHSDECYLTERLLICPYNDLSVTVGETTQQTATVTTTVEEAETTTEIITEATTEEATTEVTTEAITEQATAEVTTEAITEQATAEVTTEAITEQTTAEVTTEVITEQATTEAVHIHTEECYETVRTLICTLSEHTHEDICYLESYSPVGEELSEQQSYEYKKAQYIASLEPELLAELQTLSEYDYNEVTETLYCIELLPTLDEYFTALDNYYYSGDEQGETEYFLDVQDKLRNAVAHYQGLGELEKLIFSLPKLEELRSYTDNFSGSVYTTGTSDPVTFKHVNQGWSSGKIDPIIVHGGSALDEIASGSLPNQYWYGIVVEYSIIDDYYYVSEKYTAGTQSSATTIRNLSAESTKGFVLYIWSADSNPTTEQRKNSQVAADVQVGDIVTLSTDPTAISSGYSSSGYGTVTFSEYTEPVESEQDLDWYTETSEPSDSQIVDGGGRTVSADGKVITTKTIDGTDEENIFDITLTVETKSDIQTFLSEPDMAVVLVMDVSNTMNSNFSGDTVSRYDAAVQAAKEFIDLYAEETDGLSQIGFVAFNTHAHEIFPMQPCGTAAKATALKTEMADDTYAIVKQTSYSDSHDRFTNVEGGLKMAYDMLKSSGNSHQYIILLTDGFPTTYLKDNGDSSTNYEGYDPYCTGGTEGTDGVFYDSVVELYCREGTSYSDKAAIKAREMATRIKNQGTSIFSIGVDVKGQTIQKYLPSSGDTLSIVDRTGTSYEIGGANDLNAYKNWLGNSIGSGYYYDSTNSEGIEAAFTNIFATISELNQNTNKTVWTITDPMPVYDEEPSVVGFIHFYDKDGNAVRGPERNPEKIDGTHTVGGENTAYHEDNIVKWDLKLSGYTTEEVTEDDVHTIYYKYSIKYRVRLVNEKTNTQNENFVSGKTYETNGDAYVEYRNVVEINDVQYISELRQASFSKPAVKGYLSELTFNKHNELGMALPGAVFTLAHDDESCTECHGDSTAITDSVTHDSTYTDDHIEHIIGPFTATADESGAVSFTEIPSGHIYTLTETQIPQGYYGTDSSYSVSVEYGVLTVTETLADGTQKLWNGINDIIVNRTGYTLPETGGTGVTQMYIIGGLLITSAIAFSCSQAIRKRRRRIKQ